MNTNLKKLLCALLAVMVICAMAACRSGGSETTAPSGSEMIPTVTLPIGTAPENEGVSDWIDPAETEPDHTDPAQETTEPAQAPDVDPDEDPDEDPNEDYEDDPVPPEVTDPIEPTQKPTQPKEDEEPSTQPSQPQTGTQEPVVLTYEEYMALSPADQQAYYESFPSLEDFIAWHNEALAEYEENQDTIVATGPIDIGDYINP